MTSSSESCDTLLIGWADSVKIGRVVDRSKMDVVSGLPKKGFEIIVRLLFFNLNQCQLKTDFIVSGIAPLDENSVVLLAFITDVSGESMNVNVISDTPIKKNVWMV